MSTLFKKHLFILPFLIVFGCKTSRNISKIDPNADAPDSTEVKVDAPEKLIYRAAESRIWDLIHTHLDLSFDWENQYVNGIAVLELSPYFFPQDDLTLDAKGFDILKVSKLTPQGQQDLSFEYDGEELDVTLDTEYTKGDKIQIRIEYIAKPNERTVGGSEAITSDKGLYFINPLGEEPNKPQQIWTQGETESNSAWFPTIDSPNERCTQEMYITVNDRFKTLSNGTLVYSQKNEDHTRTDYWKMDKPHAPYLFMLAIGEFSVVKDKWNNIPIDYWVEPEYEKYAKDVFGNTPEMMTFFSELLDYPFPWAKYSQVVVRDYVSGAMENTTASVFMEDLQITSREKLDENWDYIIAHELMHQWFGDLVTCESWSNLPLNEGFANYSEYLWNEYKYGQEEADYNNWIELNNYLSEAEAKQVPLVRYYYEDREDMFDNHSYAKAGLTLHMLRKYIGDEAFFASLNLYLKSNAFQSVEIHDLRLAFEEVTGEDMNWFFDQWYFEPGHPILDVSHTYENDSLYLYINQVQDTTIAPIYTLPVFIDVYANDEVDRYPLMVQNLSEEYQWYYPSKPNLVLFDSDQQLLGEVYHEKSDEELSFQYSNSELFIPRFEALNEIQERLDSDYAEEITKKALDDPNWRIKSLAIDLASKNEMLSDAAVLTKVESYLDHERSDVRASALSALLELDAYTYIDQLQEALKDSAYSVVGVALATYVELPDAESEVVESYADEKNVNVLLPVADYYLQNGDSTKYGWFVNKSKLLTGTDQYYFLQYLVQYMLEAPLSQQESSIEFFKNLALNGSQYYTRLMGVQGLMVVSEIEGVMPIIIEAVSKETDPRLIEFYDQLREGN
ncbi:MAG: M1 family aminopeptidase [Cyclobacteriaceae bacterium]